jgi:tetratricopeptide (TPR) repeat protein
MKQWYSEKYSIAWFKLAECVSRGEREKAFGVFRLLSHSLNDTAFAIKLEGDIFWAFKDNPNAIAKYKQAALMYLNQKKYREASSMYEQIVMLDAHEVLAATKLIELYGLLGNQSKLKQSAGTVLEYCIKNNQSELASTMLQQLHLHLSVQEVGQLCVPVVLNLINERRSDALIIPWLYKVLDGFAKSNDAHALQSFLSMLNATSSGYYQDAQLYLSRQK